MNIQDFNAWCAQAELADTLEECKRIRQALGINTGATRSDPGVRFVADLVREREDRIKNPVIGFQAWEEIGIGVVNPKVTRKVMNRYGNIDYMLNPVVQHAVDVHAKAPILVTNQARAESESIPFSAAERRAILGLPSEEKK